MDKLKILKSFLKIKFHNIGKFLIKVSSAYIIGAFALIQVSSIITDNISIKDSIGIETEIFMQYLFILVLAVFPIFLIFNLILKRKSLDSHALSTLNSNLNEIDDYRPKIAVIPFENLNKDDDGQFLVDGIAEDLLMELSMVKELSVATRKTCFGFKDKDITSQSFKEEWGFDYVVTGSIRAIDNRLRILIELSDMTDDRVIWTNKFDKENNDIFEIQDEIVTKIVNCIVGEIEITSLKRANRKPTSNMTSYEYTLKGRALNQQYNKESNAESIKMLNAAIEADNTNPLPYSWKACTMGQAMGLGFVEQTDEFMGEFFQTLTKANELNDSDWNANRILGEVHLSMHEFDKTRIHATKAYNANPNNTAVMSIYADALIRTNDIEKGIEILNKAYETEPIPFVDSNSDRWFKALGFAYFLKNDIAKASKYFTMMEELDERSWLINGYINKDNDCMNENWFISGKNRFKNTDWQVSVDRFHLPSEDIKLNLQNYAMSL